MLPCCLEFACPQLLQSLSQLIHTFLFTGADSKDAVAALFPSDVHSGLRSLLSKLLLQNLPEWRESLLSAAVGPAKLVEFDWRVDVKSASNHLILLLHSFVEKKGQAKVGSKGAFLQQLEMLLEPSHSPRQTG